MLYLTVIAEIKNLKIFHTNVRTNKPELLPEFWSICRLRCGILQAIFIHLSPFYELVINSAKQIYPLT